jgi:hypothetical protein
LTESWSDTELAFVLVDLGRHIAQPGFSLAPRVHAAVDAAPAARRFPRVALVAAAVVLVMVIVTASIAPARDAVARFLGLGTTTVERVDTLPSTEPREKLPSRGDVQQLLAQLHDASRYVPDAALVGTPVAWDVGTDAATIAWPEVILSQGTGGAPVTKLTPHVNDARFVNVGNVSGLWVPGPHVREVDGRRFQSDSALVWVDHGIEFRLEGNLSLTRMLTIAESLHTA